MVLSSPDPIWHQEAEVGYRGPAWASNLIWCPFCDMNSTLYEPIPQGGQGLGGKRLPLAWNNQEGGGQGEGGRPR